MKREALKHPKMYDLAHRLGVDHARAIGIVTLMLDYAADWAERGDIGRLSDNAIAAACCWTVEDGTPEQLIAALVESGWLDQCDTYRLVIHDIHVHAENWWKTKLQKNGKTFVHVTHDGRTSDVRAMYETRTSDATTTQPSTINHQPKSTNTRSTSNTAPIGEPVEVDHGEQQREPDLEAVQLRASELMQQLPETADDTRFVTQVAWLIEAGLPIAAIVQDALNGVRAINPNHPVRYLQTCIANKIGREQFAAMRRKAPPCKRLQPAERPHPIGAAHFGLTPKCLPT